MEETTFTLDGTPEGGGGPGVFVRRWSPSGRAPAQARAAVQLAHGMGEHSARYARFAEALTGAGYVVYANDHRGHGHTAPDGTLGDFGPDGWNGLVSDLGALGAHIDAETGDLPRVLFGHSMGSFALQQFLLDHSSTIAGAVLSGTSAGDVIAAAGDTPPEPGAPSMFDLFNAAFAPNRTDADWLSRDDAEVDKYVADPLCGFEVTPESMGLMAANAGRLADPAAIANIRSDLPILMISGSADPLAGGLTLVELVAQRYRDAGVSDVETHWYTDARHELLNETNRDEVTADVIAWLDRVVG